MKKIKVVELFAGVGGFRLGLEKNKEFEVVWSNQWEPSTKKQHATKTRTRNKNRTRNKTRIKKTENATKHQKTHRTRITQQKQTQTKNKK